MSKSILCFLLIISILFRQNIYASDVFSDLSQTLTDEVINETYDDLNDDILSDDHLDEVLDSLDQDDFDLVLNELESDLLVLPLPTVPLAIDVSTKGALALAGLISMIFPTISFINGVNPDLWEDAKDWAYENWDSISHYFQALPYRTQAYLAKLGGAAISDIGEVYDLTMRELDDLSNYVFGDLHTFMMGFSGLYTAIRELLFGWLDVAPKQTVSDFAPSDDSNTYRIFNVRHDHGTGVRIDTTTYPFFAPGFPYGVAYEAVLEEYNYGWEYIDLSIAYYFNLADGGRGLIRTSYISKLSPNQQYDGRIYSTIDYTSSESYNLSVQVLESGSTSWRTVYNEVVWGSGTSYQSDAQRFYDIVDSYISVPVLRDASAFNHIIDLAPLPEDLVILSPSINNTTSRFGFNGYEFAKVFITPSGRDGFTIGNFYDTDLREGVVVDIMSQPGYTFDYGNYETTSTLELPDDPLILDNPINIPLPDPEVDPETNPDVNVPEGFFDLIAHYINFSINWMTNFFTEVWTSFKESMIDLFVPSDNFISDTFNKEKDEIAVAFDYMSWDHFEDTLSSSDSQKPLFVVSIYGQEVNLIDLGFWEKYKQYIDGLIIAVVGFLLFLYNLRMFQWLIRSSDQYNQSSNVNQSGSPGRSSVGGRFK